jgi:Antirestriction protein
METSIDSLIVATLVPEAARLAFLPRHFGRQMLVFEQTLYTQMSQLCADYSGSYWDFYDLSNGGCYLAPSAGSYRIAVAGNYFEGILTADAAGITATLFTMNALSFRFPQCERLSAAGFRLRARRTAPHPRRHRLMARACGGPSPAAGCASRYRWSARSLSAPPIHFGSVVVACGCAAALLRARFATFQQGLNPLK